MKTVKKGPRLRRLPSLWFVYQDGLLDYIATSRKMAEEMGEDPEGGKDYYQIERWDFKKGSYRFARRIR